MQHGCKNDSIANSGAPGPWLDRIGIGVSLTCAIHCIAAAVLAAAPAFAATAAPGLGEQFEWAESALLWAALAVGLLALLPAYRHSRRPGPLVVFGVGLGCLLASRTFEPASAEIAATVLGVALVAAAHVLNLLGRHAHAR